VETLDLIAVGDVSLVCQEGKYPFEHVARYLRAGDILFGNLETALSDTHPTAEKEVTLGVPPSRAEYLRRAGFDIVSIANNHTLDCGPEGLSQTLAALREQGIRFVGAGDSSSPKRHEITERRGLRVGFLAYCEDRISNLPAGMFVNRIERPTIFEHVHGLRSQCDVIVVSLHWGIEYVHYPSPQQIRLARELIRHGVTLVLGHHPHVVQGVEQIGAGLIAYSLGSFQFEPRKEEARHSFILHARIGARGMEGYNVVPAHISEGLHPRRVRGGHRREMLRFIERISTPIREDRITESWWFEQAGPTYLVDSLRAWVARVRKYGVRHLMPFMRWLASGFTVKCCLGLLRTRIGRHE